MVTKFNINDELDKFHKLRPTNLQNMETIVKLKNKEESLSKSDSKLVKKPQSTSESTHEPTPVSYTHLRAHET